MSPIAARDPRANLSSSLRRDCGQGVARMGRTQGGACWNELGSTRPLPGLKPRPSAHAPHDKALSSPARAPMFRLPHAPGSSPMQTVLAVTASIAALLAAPAAWAQAADPAARAVSVAPVNWRHRTLPTGVEGYSIKDARSPNAAVQVWYKVGSKDEPTGRLGFAHLCEHMMFKATRDMPSEYFDRITEDVGGQNNASTNDDYTEYHEVVPANYLETVLWAAAARMGSLVVDDAAFTSARDVVKEEYRQRVLAQPYGKMFSIYNPELSFQVSPYGRPGIGSIEDLDSATVQDVQAFHATNYRPDNAVLVVVGDFDDAKLDAWVDRYFGALARPSGPLPRVAATAPARTGAKTWTAYEANTPLPAVMITYPFPPASDPDLPALIVADAILAKGESSRLYHSQ